MSNKQETQSVVLPAQVAIRLRALIAEYDPETFSAGVILTMILEELSNHLKITLKEEEENEEQQT